jgi:dihydropyrimidinase
LLWSEGVQKGRIPATRFVDAIATEPAKLFGMYPRKGTLQPGADADILIWDPDAEWTVRASELTNPAGYSVYEGWQIKGRPWRTWLRGQPLLTSEGVTVEPGFGRAVARSARGSSKETQHVA